MGKWTPGPWSLGGAGHGKYRCAIVAADYDGTYVCEVISHPVWQANAHMLAAAPELYEALGELMDAVGDMPADPAECWPEAWALAEAALAKARGKGGE